MPGSILGLGRPPGEGIGYSLHYSWASLVAQMIKNAPAMQESWIQSLGQENPLKKGMDTHFNFLAWRIPWTEEPGRLRRSDIAFSATGYAHKQFPSAPPAPAQHKPETFISLKHSNMESFLHWCRIVPPDSWATMERILRYFETQNRKRTVIACSGSLHAKSKDPVVQVSWNK